MRFDIHLSVKFFRAQRTFECFDVNLTLMVNCLHFSMKCFSTEFTWKSMSSFRIVLQHMIFQGFSRSVGFATDITWMTPSFMFGTYGWIQPLFLWFLKGKSLNQALYECIVRSLLAFYNRTLGSGIWKWNRDGILSYDQYTLWNVKTGRHIYSFLRGRGKCRLDYPQFQPNMRCFVRLTDDAIPHDEPYHPHFAYKTKSMMCSYS